MTTEQGNALVDNLSTLTWDAQATLNEVLSVLFTSGRFANYGGVMEFQVLGPLQVRAEGVRLDLGGPKQRAVLALLLANAGQPVSTERLIEGAYGDGAPDAARRSVQTFVSKLRGQMGEMISSTGRGYEFTLEDSSVDSVEFATLLESARRLIVDDPVAAGETLRAALALWRGHPYQDVDAMGLLDAEITRLTDLRLVALELRLDADLAAGYHRELIGELEALTAEHAFQERFYAQLMLALYRSGRQAEALRTYQRMREMLAEELGIDPSPPLRDLEQRILEQDPALQLEPSSSVGRRVILVADLGVTALRDLAAPETRSAVLHDVDRVISTAIADHGGELAAQEATTTYALFDGIRPAADAAATIVGAAPHVNGAPIVKVALDVGEVERRNDGTIGGPLVIRAAGLVAAAHPGQVLLSADGHVAAGADATAGLVTRSLGIHAIPRLEQAEPVHQIVVPGIPGEFGPLDTGGEAPALPESRLGVPGYELRDEIGRGVFGTVYRAYQPSVGREVAVKVVNPEIANDTGFIRRFGVEAQMIARIEHPHVVPVYDYWRDPSRAMLVMRLMRGGNLAQRAASTSLGRDEVVRLVDQIAGALSAAHERGIVHGDVRPANVLLNESGDFFLGDLGLAAVATVPEEGISPRNDVAAFAAMTQRLARQDALPDAAVDVLTAAAAGHFADAGALSTAWHEAIGEGPAVPYTPTRNPYKGLAAFGEPDAADFKGRDAAIEQLTGAVAVNRLVAVVGPSGIGKSSVVRAGLIPALRSGAVNGSEDWLIAEFSPGSHPFERLATALNGVAASAPQDLEALLGGDERGLIEAIERHLPDAAPLLLVVDQFEELFTLTDDDIERNQFLGTLTAAIREPTSSMRVVVTLRADFFDRPLAHAEFGRLLEAATLPLAAPSNDELNAMITEPAGALGVEFAPGLVDRMIGDIAGESGALPLLEFTLTELFDGRDTDVITQAAYDASGGVTAALGRRAEEIFEGLDEQQRLVARQVFMRLVTPGEGGRDGRRRVRTGELRRLGFDRAALDAVLTRFGEGRLLTFDRDSSTRGPTVEVAHEALLAEWPRMREWLDTHREELLLRNRLGAAVADWQRSGWSDDYLLQGGRLEQHEVWTAATALPLSRDEKDLLARSRRATDEAAARRKRVRRWVTAGFATAAVVALVLAAFALNSGREAGRQREQAEAARARAEQEAATAAAERDRAQSNAERADAAAAEATAERERAEGRALLAAVPEALESDPQTALLLALEASKRLGGDTAAIAALHDGIAAARTVFETTWPVDMPTAGDLSPDGTLLAVAGRLGNGFEVHDIDAGGLAWRHQFDSTDLAIVPKFVNAGAELLVSVGWTPPLEQALDTPPSDVGFHVFDATTGAPLRRIESSRCGPIGEERFVTAVYEASDRYALVHEIAPETLDEFGCRHPDSAPVLDAFRIDSVTGERIQVVDGWEVDPDRPSALLTGMSADGRFVIVGPGGFPPPEPQGDAVVIEVDSGATVGLIEATVHGPLTLSPDGSVAAARNLAAQGDFNTTSGLLRFNDVAAGMPLVETVTPEADVGLIHPAFTADGRRVLATYADGAVRFFEVSTGQQVDVVTGPGPAVLFARLTPDGRRMAMFTAGPTVRVVTLDPAEVAEAGIFEHCGDAPTRDHFYPNRAIVAHDPYVTINATCDGQATPTQSRTYDFESGELIATRPTTGQAWAVGAGHIAALQTWRQDGDEFVVGEMVLQDLISGEVLTTLDGVCAWLWPDGESCISGQQGLDVFNSDLAMSNDGSVVAVVGRDRPGRAWNLSNGARGELPGENDAVAISPDGHRLVTSNGGTGVMRLYATDDFGLVGEMTFAEPFAVRALQFTPDGTELVGADEDVFFHDPETLEITRRFIAPHDVVRDIDFNDDGSLMATGGADGFARVWDVASGDLVHEIALDDRIQAVAFVGGDTRLAVSTVPGPVRVFLVDVDELRQLAGERLIRGFTETECRAHFPDGECPSLEDVRSS